MKLVKVGGKKMSNTRRFNIFLPVELHEYYKSESERLGVSMSSLIVLDLQNHKEQREAMKSMNQLQMILEKLEEFKKSVGDVEKNGVNK